MCIFVLCEHNLCRPLPVPHLSASLDGPKFYKYIYIYIACLRVSLKQCILYFSVVFHYGSATETRDKLEKRGYVYRCQGCQQYEGEKRYVEAHYMKYHTSLDAVPFYCSLCHFMGKTEKELVKHVRGYRPHSLAIEGLERQGKAPEPDSTYIHRNANPLAITEEHVTRLSWDESQRVWAERAKGAAAKTPAPEAAAVADTMVVAVQPVEEATDPLKVLPDALKSPESTVPAPSLPDLPLPVPDLEVNVLDEILQDQGPDPFSMEAKEEERLQLMRDTLNTLKLLLEATKQNGQLLTSLNTGVRANSMVLRDIADNQRTQLREDRRWRSEERAERVRQRFVPARTRSSTSTSRSTVRSVVKKADRRK